MIDGSSIEYFHLPSDSLQSLPRNSGYFHSFPHTVMSLNVSEDVSCVLDPKILAIVSRPRLTVASLRRDDPKHGEIHNKNTSIRYE